MNLILRNPDDPNTVTINYAWLPTWIGLNQALLSDVANQLLEEFSPRPLRQDTLNEMEIRLIDLLSDRLKMPDLRNLLYALRGTSPLASSEAGHEEDR